MADHNTTGAISRRNVLKTAGGLVAGATAAAGRGSALPDRTGPLRVEVEEANEEYIAVKVYIPDGNLFDQNSDPASAVVLDLADQFIIHEDEDAVSLPEDTDGLASPVEKRKMSEQTYLMYFQTEDVDWPKEYGGDEITLGLGVFPERTVSSDQWDTDSVLFERVQNNL